jgi:hypothetical protein
MAENEEVLEELYELLTLYFGIRLGGGIVKTGTIKHVEPPLDRLILRERVLTRITTLITEVFLCNSEGGNL